jgi:hypothetical protein
MDDGGDTMENPLLTNKSSLLSEEASAGGDSAGQNATTRATFEVTLHGLKDGNVSDSDMADALERIMTGQVHELRAELRASGGGGGTTRSRRSARG